jgi:hypothetical protein
LTRWLGGNCSETEVWCKKLGEGFTEISKNLGVYVIFLAQIIIILALWKIHLNQLQWVENK